MEVSREISFKALHSHHGMLTEPLHEHEFRVRVVLGGTPNEEGFIADFRAVKRIFKRLVANPLEGRNLDELFEFATSENLAQWIWTRLDPFFPLVAIEVSEKPHSVAIYRGRRGEVWRGEA